jgi:hypothetical protein
MIEKRVVPAMLEQRFVSIPIDENVGFPEHDELFALINNETIYYGTVDRQNFGVTCMLRFKANQGFEEWAQGYEIDEIINFNTVKDNNGTIRVLIVNNNQI